MEDSRSRRGSGTFATPTFGSTFPELYFSTAAWAPVRMLNRVVFPTFAKPSRPIFTAFPPRGSYQGRGRGRPGDARGTHNRCGRKGSWVYHYDETQGRARHEEPASFGPFG